jgi:hypothetical protein
MHLEILVEDSSGKRALERIKAGILGAPHTCAIHAYRGIGRIPQNLRAGSDPSKRILLDQLPKLLRGYGKTFAGYPSGYSAAVIVVCDLDSRCQKEFRDELLNVLDCCEPRPVARFCLAIEEMEAWFLGDPEAIRAAYPQVNESPLRSYVADSICGTWEVLADVLYPGGATSLKSEPYSVVGTEKHRWAGDIPPMMNLDDNSSPSFVYFRDTVRKLVSG